MASMTLIQWLGAWPHRVLMNDGEASVEDSTFDPDYRAIAWKLIDYRVVTVKDGRIWFVKREEDR